MAGKVRLSVVLEQYKEDGKGIRVTKIQIQTADGAKRMGRPIGNYMTLESADKEHSDEHSDKNLSGTKLPDTNLLASYINGLLPSSAHSFFDCWSWKCQYDSRCTRTINN